MVFCKKKRKRKIKMILVAGLLSSVIIATNNMNVYAGSTGTDGGGGSGSGSVGSGINTQGPGTNQHKINGQGVTQVIEFGFVPTSILGIGGLQGDLREVATEQDLAVARKFTGDAGRFALYMPLNSATSTDFSASGILDFDGANFYIRGGWDRSGITNNQGGSSSGLNWGSVKMPTPKEAMSSDNFCLKVMGEVLSRASGDPNGVYSTEYGATLESKFESLNKGDRAKFFEDYCKLLSGAGASKSQIDGLKKDFSQGKVSFIAQTLQRVHLGTNKANGSYISTHALTRSLGASRGASSELPLREYRYLHDARPNGFGGACWGAGKCNRGVMCALLKHPGYGTYKYTKEGYTGRIQAKADKVAPNIFGGWGFFHLQGQPKEATPELTVQVKIKLAGGGEIVKETEIKDLEINKIVQDGSEYPKKLEGLFLTGTTFTHGGKQYKIENPQAKTEWVDEKDKEGLYGSYAQVGGKTDKGEVKVGIVKNNVYVDVFEAINPSDLKELNYYLGASSSDETAGEEANEDFGGMEGKPSNVVDKYADKPAEPTGEKAHGDAKLVIELQAKEVDKKEEIDEDFIVPQWRLSRYWEDVAGHIQDEGWGEIPRLDMYTIGEIGECVVGDPHVDSIYFPGGDAHSIPEGETNMVHEFDESKIENWLEVEDYLRRPEGKKGRHNRFTPKAVIEHGVVTELEESIGTVDMLAIRTTADIDNVYISNWVNKGTVEKIDSKNKGDTDYKYKDELKKEVTLKFQLKESVPYRHNVPTYSHRQVAVEWDEKGNPIAWEDICECYVNSVRPEVELSETELQYGVKYLRHHPKDIETKKFPASEGLSNGIKWYLKPTKGLKIYPEVAMVKSDNRGNNSANIVSGDKSREVTPLAYHEVTFEQKTDGKVVGTSIATDKKGETLVRKVAKGMSYDEGGTQVTHKGSPLNISYVVEGEIVSKTWAIDIGDEGLKKAWNPGLDYDTKRVHEEFVSKYSPVQVKYTPSIYVGKTKQAGTPKTYTLKGNMLPDEEYKLVVRSGKLRLVDENNVNVSSTELIGKLGEEMVRALKMMKLIGDVSVLDVFEYNTGNPINEEEVAGLMNAIREVTGETERWVIPDKGNWYHEDTTVLVLRKHTEVFPLPKVFTYSDKLKMVYSGLETPVDKNLFYNTGQQGHTKLQMDMLKTGLTSTYFSQTGENSLKDKPEMKFVVPNVSVLDTTK